MSISSISTASVTHSADNSARVQSERHPKRLDTTDTAPRASQAAVEAERSAIDAQQVAAVSGSMGRAVDLYL
jgi:hypothetical protein